MTAEEAQVAPGTTGLLYDDTPNLTHATVRPFIWAILLYRGAIKSHEATHAISALCSVEELKAGWAEEALDEEDDRSRLQWLVDEVLGDMTACGLLRYNEQKDLWVLVKGQNDRNLPEIIKAVAGINGQMPFHLNLER